MASTNASFIKKKMKIEDSGEYTVNVTLANNQVSSSKVQVSVVGKPIIFTKAIKGDATLKCGEELNLTATTDGDDPIYQWYKNDLIIPGENKGTLVIPNVKNEVSGSYYIGAKNSLSEGKSKPVKVVVSGQLPSSVYYLSSGFNVPVTKEVLDFRFYSNPKLNVVSWTKHNPSKNVFSAVTKWENVKTPKITLEDDGLYEFKIINACGEFSKRFMIKPQKGYGSIVIVQ